MSPGASLALRGHPAAGRLGRRLIATLLIAAALVACYLLLIRDLPVFAVKDVRIDGISSGTPGAADLEAALTDAAKGMTTLHVRAGELEETAERFPLAKSISAQADFPSGMTITVDERRPSALIGAGEDAVAIGDDGVVMTGLPAGELDLPSLPLDRAPSAERLAGPVLDQALVFGAAPKAMLPLIDHARREGDGVTVVLDAGIELRFGVAARVAEKWRAATAVLADPDLAALDYVDLSAPNRPSVGGAGHLLPPAL